MSIFCGYLLTFFKVRLDGPYGLVSFDLKLYPVIMLVGGGIGGTPMISILRDIFYKYSQCKSTVLIFHSYSIFS